MKIAIISDVHNNEVNLKKVLDFCGREKIEKIICCGDLVSKETLDFMNDNFSGEIHYVFGNADYDDVRELAAEKKYKKTYIYKDFGKTTFKKKEIAFTHFPEIAKGLARTGEYDFVFYGHTHRPWTEKIGNCTLLNPGTTGGEIYPPTFAVWDVENEKFELKRIHELK